MEGELGVAQSNTGSYLLLCDVDCLWFVLTRFGNSTMSFSESVVNAEA